jgi:hypothetical protein
MARITRVKKAQQRYATKPTLDENGQQKRVPVMNPRTGEQKVSKRGPVFRNLTERDLSKPLPMPTCDYGKCEHPSRTIQPGEPYMWIAPKSGPYGGRALHRHGDHPGWNVWEYSYSTSAQVARITNDIEEMLDATDWSEEGAFDDARTQAAEMASGLRDEKEEALNNMPEALQDGSQTQEQHEALESWVEEIENASEPDRPEPDTDCPECEGSGQVENPEYDEDDEDSEEYVDCEECEGTGEVEGQDLNEDQLAEYEEACREAIMEAVNNCYV